MMTPSTSFDFTSAVLDPRITFARALNTATRVNSSGYIEAVNADTPRFDYSPVTLASLGLLVEETRTNLLRHTSDFSSGWAGSNASISANASAAPTGTLIAAKVVENAANTTHFINQGVTTSLGTYTATVYAKAAERTKFQIASNTGAIPGATFDLVAVTATPVGSTSAASIKDVGGGWYRCSATRTVTGAADAFVFRLLDAAGNISYTGDGVSGMFIYGAQLEVGAFQTSFIPTTTAAVTRNADVATITGANFSDWWQASKGGAQVQAIPSTISGIRPLVQYDDGTADNIIALRGNAANPELQIVDGGAPQVQLDAGTIVANTPYSLTGWWQTNDCKARQNSGATVSDYTATIPTVTQARLGSDGTNYLNGHLATVNYYTSFFGQSIYTRRKNKVFASLL